MRQLICGWINIDRKCAVEIQIHRSNKIKTTVSILCHNLCEEIIKPFARGGKKEDVLKQSCVIDPVKF